MQEIKDKFLKYWFIFSVFAVAGIYFIFTRKNYKLQELLEQTKRDALLNKLEKIEEKSQKSAKDYYDSLEDYDNLKRRHNDILIKYGLLPYIETNKRDQ